MAKLDKVRLQFDVSKLTLAEIDDLCRTTSFGTRAELFRHALKLFCVVTKKQEAGYKIVFKRGTEEVTLVFLE